MFNRRHQGANFVEVKDGKEEDQNTDLELVLKMKSHYDNHDTINDANEPKKQFSHRRLSKSRGQSEIAITSHYKSQTSNQVAPKLGSILSAFGRSNSFSRRPALKKPEALKIRLTQQEQ